MYKEDCEFLNKNLLFTKMQEPKKFRNNLFISRYVIKHIQTKIIGIHKYIKLVGS